MAIEPGWVFLSVALAFESSLVALLILPAPNNNVRGAVTRWVARLTHSGAVRFGLLGVVAMSAFYLWYVRDALLNPLLFIQDQFGFDVLSKKGFLGCEYEVEAFRAERNALICAANLFLYLVLHRLVDIQSQLFQQRAVAKAAAPGAPMNKVPMGTKID